MWNSSKFLHIFTCNFRYAMIDYEGLMIYEGIDPRVWAPEEDSL